VRLRLVALLAAAAAAGCGGEREPRDVAIEYAGTNKPEKCDLLARSLVEQLTDQQGEAAMAACRRNVARFDAPKEVKVRDEGKGEDEHAEHEAEERGEAEVPLLIDGREAEVKLERRDGEWVIVALGE
jgi:hypothetical protein